MRPLLLVLTAVATAAQVSPPGAAVDVRLTNDTSALPFLSLDWEAPSGGGPVDDWVVRFDDSSASALRVEHVVTAAPDGLLFDNIMCPLPGTWTATVTARGPGGEGPPATSDEVLVEPRPSRGLAARGFEALVDRPPTPAELDGADQQWCASRQTELITSAASREAFVVRVYDEALGRAPDTGGLQHWSANVHILEVPTQAFVWGSDEARRRHADLAAWLDAVYQRFLHRPADPAGRSFWLRHGAAGAVATVDAILRSPEGVAGRIDDAYQRVLARHADRDGLAAWRDLMAGDGEFDLYWRLLTSPEFAAGT